MKKILFLTSLAFAFLALPFFLAGPVAAQVENKDEIKGLDVDVLKPFEKAEAGKVGLPDLKKEQLKKASHVIIKDVDPPRIKGDRLKDFDGPKINKATVKPFDVRDNLSPLALPLATDHERAGAAEFQDLDDQFKKDAPKLDKGQKHGTSADAPLVHKKVESQQPVRMRDAINTPGGMNTSESSIKTSPSKSLFDEAKNANTGQDAKKVAKAAKSGDHMARKAQKEQKLADKEAAKQTKGLKEVSFGNRLSKADVNSFQFDDKKATDVADKANKKADKAAEEKAFEFNHMAGTDQFGGDINGIPGSTQPMSVESGSASLDMNNNLSLSVKGLKNADGTSAEGQRFGAGVACMDSGYFKAGGDEGFTLDASGSAEFSGQLDFAGQSCVAPMPMVMNEEGSFVAVGAHSAKDDDKDKGEFGNDDFGKDDDDKFAKDKDDDEFKFDDDDKFAKAEDKDDFKANKDDDKKVEDKDEEKEDKKATKEAAKVQKKAGKKI
jgi:hypothetical protein